MAEIKRINAFDGMSNHQSWIDEASARGETLHQIGDLDLKARDNPQDESLPIFQELLQRGYDKVMWHSENSNCPHCQPLNGKEWALGDFINGTTHNAPVFSRTHPGDRSCFCIVTGPDLEDIRVGPYPFS